MIEIDFKKGNGLVPCVVQDVKTNQVLMLAYMNEASLQETIDSGLATYWSRSRKELWKKGETSGHYQHVKEILIAIRFYSKLCKMVPLAIRVNTVVFIVHWKERKYYDYSIRKRIPDSLRKKKEP